MKTFRQLLCGLLFLLLSGCSFQGTLDKMVSSERQAELVAVGKNICTDAAKVTPLLHPEIANTLAEGVTILPRECPAGDAEWQLTSYSWRTAVANGVTERQEEAVVVATAPGKWTTVDLRFYRQGEGPLQITAWNVLGSTTRPPTLLFIDTYEQTARTLRWVVPVGVVAIALLIGWLILRRRRRRAG